MSADGTVEPSRCWVCGSADTRVRRPRTLDRPLSAADLRISDDRYGTTLALRQCRACSFVFAEAAELEALPALYAQLSDPDYLDEGQARTRQMRWLLERILRVKPDARSLLDIGAGAGLLVGEARRLNLEAIGVEPSAALSDAAQSRGLDVRRGSFPRSDLTGRRFDVVCLIDVLEHVSDPVQLLRDCAGALSEAGLVAIATPDAGSVAARVMRGRWWHYRPAHIGYFDRRSLRLAAERAGLRVLTMGRPRWFFTVQYLGARLSRYLPLTPLLAATRQLPGMRRLSRVVIPVNPHDSLLAMLGRRSAGHT